jgi:hypothetical protein
MYITKIKNNTIIKEFLGTTRAVNNKVNQFAQNDYMILSDILLPKNMDNINKISKFFLVINDVFFEHVFSTSGLSQNRFSYSYTLHFSINEAGFTSSLPRKSKLNTKKYDIYAVDEYDNILDSATNLSLTDTFFKKLTDAENQQVSLSILNEYIDNFYIVFNYEEKEFYININDENIDTAIEKFKDIYINFNDERYDFGVHDRKNIIERDFSDSNNFYYKLSEFILSGNKSISNITNYLYNDSNIRDISIYYLMTRKSSGGDEEKTFRKNYIISSDICKEIIELFLKYKKEVLASNLRFRHIIQRSNEKNLVFDFSDIDARDIGLLTIGGISDFSGHNIHEVYSNDQFNESSRIFFYEKPLNTLLEKNIFIYFAERQITSILFKIQNSEENFRIHSVEESTNYELSNDNDFLNVYKEIYNLGIELTCTNYIDRGISNFFTIDNPIFENKDNLQNVARELRYFLSSDENQDLLSPSVENLLKNSIYYVKFDLKNDSTIIDSIEKFYSYEQLLNSPDSLLSQIRNLRYQRLFEIYPELSVIFDRNVSSFTKYRILESNNSNISRIKVYLELEFNILSDFKSTNDYRFKGFDQEGFTLNNVYSIPITSNDSTNEIIYNANTTLSNFIFSIRDNEIDFQTHNLIKGKYLSENLNVTEKISLIKDLTKKIKNRSFFERKRFIQEFLLNRNILKNFVSQEMSDFLERSYIQVYASNYNIRQISENRSVIIAGDFVTNVENQAGSYNNLVRDLDSNTFDNSYKALLIQSINIDQSELSRFKWKIKYSPNITISSREFDFINDRKNFTLENNILWFSDEFFNENRRNDFKYFNELSTLAGGLTQIDTSSNNIIEDDNIISFVTSLKIEGMISKDHINYLLNSVYSVKRRSAEGGIHIKGIAVKVYFYDSNNSLFTESFYNIPFLDSNNRVLERIDDRTLNSMHTIDIN